MLLARCISPFFLYLNTLQRGNGLDSGVIIDPGGYIVTNNHVVNGAQNVEVTLYDGTTVPAQVVGTAPADDLAILKIALPKEGLKVAVLGDSSKLRVGQSVLAIGNPLGDYPDGHQWDH